jgi:hypothetical protein
MEDIGKNLVFAEGSLLFEKQIPKCTHTGYLVLSLLYTKGIHLSSDLCTSFVLQLLLQMVLPSHAVAMKSAGMCRHVAH